MFGNSSEVKEMTDNWIGVNMSESLDSEACEYLRNHRTMITVIFALGTKMAKMIRREHLEYLLANKDMISDVIKAGGTAAWILINTAEKMQKPYIGTIME